MKKLRFGNYEIHRFDELNIGLFEVLPDGKDAKRGKARFRISDDGKRLQFLGKYYGSYGAAARALHQMLLAEHIEDAGCATVAEAIERAVEDFRPISDAVEAVGSAADVRG